MSATRVLRPVSPAATPHEGHGSESEARFTDQPSEAEPAVQSGRRPLLTTRELADHLRLSPATVLRRYREGLIPGFRLASNVLRFDPDEIDAWLTSRRGHETLSRRYTHAG